MKTAKRVLAILLAMLMAVSAFAVAASAAESIASQLASGSTASISQNTRESVVITKDATIDLGGKILKSVPGSPAITVKNGAKVTIKNGYVESYFENYSGVTPELLDRIGSAAPAGIVAYGSGTTVVLEDVRVLGGEIRIPSTTEWFFPVGSAVKIYGGATLELNGAVLVGSYAVSNDPAGTGRPDGTVKINEAILFGYIDYIKRVTPASVIVPDTVEKVNAANRIVGILNDNVHLTEGELDLLKKAMDDRVYIFTQKPVDDTAIVTINKNTDKAVITASTVDDYLSREDGTHKNTDCCYKYVPEYAYDVESGAKFALDDPTIDAVAVDGKDIRINYRLEFELKGDFKKLADKLANDQSMEFFRRYYNKAVAKADAAYAEVIAKYDEYVNKFVDLYKDVDSAGAQGVTINGTLYTLENELGDNFYAILRAILSLGGVSVYKKATGATEMTTDVFSTRSKLYNYGAAKPAEGTYDTVNPHEEVITYVRDGQGNLVPVTETIATITRLGPLDRIDPIVEQFKAIKGDSSLGEQSKWVQYAHLAIDNYRDILKVFGEAETALRAFANLVNTNSTIKSLVNQMGMQAQVKQITDLADAARDAKVAVETAMDNPIVKAFTEKIDANANNGTVETYVAKAQGAVNNYRQYVHAEDFVVEDGAFALAYTVSGPTTTQYIEKAKLHVSTFGGTVNFASDSIGATPATGEQWTDVPYANSVTMTAVADEGNEFLYYTDGYTDRILSTNPTMVVDTQVERYIVANFESTTNAIVALTNHSGVIYESALPYSADGTDASSVSIPTFNGYDPIGWGPNGNTTLTSADFVSAYAKGNSAFENGANYKLTGYAFKLNKTTSNKYLATPKYKPASVFTITFQDGETTWSKEINVGDRVSYTAAGDNFSYWMNDKEQIVSVNRTYSVLPAEAGTFTAVYGDDSVNAAGYINIVSVIDEDVRFRVYAERSIPANRKVLSNGIIISYDSSIQEPEVKDINNSTVKAGYSTQQTNEGVYTIGLTKTSISSHPNGIFVRAYAEVQTATGSEFIYSDVYSTLD